MGISRLTSFVQPYFTSTNFGGSHRRACPEKAIFDGPSLAHYIYYKCIARRVDELNSFEAAPSYAEIGETAILWLDSLQRDHVIVHLIFFDGALPEPKVEVRHSRLQRKLRQLINYRSAHPTGIPRGTKGSAGKENDIGGSIWDPQHTTYSKAGALPPPPFIVAAVLEAFQGSPKYATLTRVVPAEADLYCAEAARKSGGIIFTSDSDLLVYDLGPEGSVVFLKDVTYSNKRTFRFPCFQPDSVARRLGIKSMKTLAWVMTNDPFASSSVAVARAKAEELLCSDPEGFELFRSSYAQVGVDSPLPRNRYLQAVFSTLDPRLSEMVCQYSFHNKPEAPMVFPDFYEGPNLQKKVLVHSYLPFLLDDPARATAWKCTSFIRRITASLLNESVTPDYRYNWLREYTRSGQRMVEKDTWIPETYPELSQDCIKLNSAIRNWRTMVAESPAPSSIWRGWWVAALEYILEWHTNESHTPPSRDALRTLLEGRTAPSSWETIHLWAEVQAVLYSLRVLKQVVDIRRAHCAGSQPQTTHGANLHDAAAVGGSPATGIDRVPYPPELEQLRDMPSLAALFPAWGKHGKRSTSQRREEEREVSRLLDKLLGVQGDEGAGGLDRERGDEQEEKQQQALEGVAGPRRRRKKKKKKKGDGGEREEKMQSRAGQSAGSGNGSQNSFAVLDTAPSL